MVWYFVNVNVSVFDACSLFLPKYFLLCEKIVVIHFPLNTKKLIEHTTLPDNSILVLLKL
jgi:hypothetical protein